MEVRLFSKVVPKAAIDLVIAVGNVTQHITDGNLYHHDVMDIDGALP